jgi:hypothetical protein
MGAVLGLLLALGGYLAVTLFVLSDDPAAASMLQFAVWVGLITALVSLAIIITRLR